ncbi:MULTISPECIES: 16S rRNA (guanine(527)-N(7))-methyltransferase RsmG [unclassified Paenibacillus]|uniref:16S rRNA (guanine(527)-N(7))-methyltransferase RsmG n=1 Tax=unclassified Paenibacillus TaxID=185978 RepID=UPI002404F10C|nr:MULTISPECIES: 16S rRNA (guanine(527)-N(7))-methyltransferase RsmG [unclassified Paenibacillus]MDF9839701.1 16S rRNA (guanine527-N7)-methyltransferase [Paenibacillus sp. PastF-2]MDF9846281.1 16S rRNA (guanine527-N7)-methyltransferase [Paenibacillus sp. PastM-2]MDF9853369.1 16S rRNA (guanine527-N7)-methyltransferase [Paenibacillus sp. PastF-1]MDH6478127.1 16S rRNA (guanine527-N7)-methyltransferase [Paenibacillus sp. PastH-2]MDH6506374.1 16S rRNA (guanine527-N7)-methyltransferase [Paenibacillu
MDSTTSQFVALLQEKGIELSSRQLEQFALYYQELVSWNEKMNLTGITERDQVYTKHFYDSLSLAFYVDLTQVNSLADIGSGAGFPGIPLKICFPHIKLTIVDSLSKRISFLQHICDTLELSGVQLIHGRAEDVARQFVHRDAYDVVTARAVARLSLLNEFCLPFTRKDGIFAAMKGNDPAEELNEAGRSLKELRAELKKVESFSLPIEESARHIVMIRKTGATPAKYPRKAGMPAKAPLI